MEAPSDQKQEGTESSKGGMRTMPFIIANETFEKVASFGLLANMIMYLTRDYHMDNASGVSILFIWSAVTNFLPILGAFLSDSYLGRFRIITSGSFISLLGMFLLWLTTMVPGARPDACDSPQSCKSPNASQLALLFSSFALMSIGAGGVRPCSLAFGADQFDKKDNPKNTLVLQSFFNWYYTSVAISIMISITVIVYIQDHKGWKVGFGIPAILMALSTIMFISGSPLYVKAKAQKSLFTGLAQVAIAAFKNRGVGHPPNNADAHYYYSKGSKLAAPTEKMRFLNKACVIRNRKEDLNQDGEASDPWKLCSVDQVENLKSLLRVIPIWSTGIMVGVTLNQHSFQVLQISTMDRHIAPKFEIPAGSFGVFGILTLSTWVISYDRLLIRWLARVTKRPRGLSLKQRMGIGILISCVATATSALVERKRRHAAIQQGLVENGQGLVHMSAMWLVPQYCLVGLGEAFNAIGQIEFYYSEFPKTMSSIGVALLSLGLGLGSLVGSLIVEIVNKASRIGGRESWVANNLNKGHYDYYYWLLTILSITNLIYFIWCSWAYGLCKEEEEGMSLEKVEVIMKEEDHASNPKELTVLI